MYCRPPRRSGSRNADKAHLPPCRSLQRRLPRRHRWHTIHLVLLRQLRGYLGEGLVGSQTDTDGHTHLTLYPFVEVLAPLLEVVKLYAVEVHETLIDGVSEVGGSLFADDTDHSSCQFTIEFVVRGKDRYLLIWEQLGQLEIGRTFLDAHRFGLIGTGYYAAVIVGEHHAGHSRQIRSENPLTTHVAIVITNYQ